LFEVRVQPSRIEWRLTLCTKPTVPAGTEVESRKPSFGEQISDCSRDRVTKLPFHQEVRKISREQTGQCWVGSKASEGDAVPESNLADSRCSPTSSRGMHRLGPRIVLAIQFLESRLVTRVKFDWNFQGLRNESRITTLLVRD